MNWINTFLCRWHKISMANGLEIMGVLTFKFFDNAFE